MRGGSLSRRVKLFLSIFSEPHMPDQYFAFKMAKYVKSTFLNFPQIAWSTYSVLHACTGCFGFRILKNRQFFMEKIKRILAS